MTLTRDREIAEAATPGPWLDLNDADIKQQWIAHDLVGPQITPDDSAFIAHFNPSKIKKMLDVIEALAEFRKELVFNGPVTRSYSIAELELLEAVKAYEQD